jgi:hypothetical protein
MWSHAKTLLWLKFTLLRHTWTKFVGARLALILMILLYISAFILSLAIAAGVFFFIFFLSDEVPAETGLPFAILVSCDVLLAIFLFFWFMGLLTEIQRSDLIDFRKMLYLPVSLRMVFVLNFADSLLSPALMFYVFPVTALILGLIVIGRSLAVAAIPLAAGYYFMLGAWTYAVRGFLVALMANKRRRRAILIALPAVFALLCQTPNLARIYFMRNHEAPHTESEQPREIASETVPESVEDTEERSVKEFEDMVQQWEPVALLGNRIIPLGWFPHGIYSLVSGSMGGASLCFLGSTLLGSLGIALGFRSTRRFYMGTQRRRKRERKVQPEVAARKQERRFIQIKLPFVDDETAAVAQAAFTTYVRHPNVRMALVMPLIVGIGLVCVYLFGKGVEIKSETVHALIGAAVLAWPMVSGAMFIFNVFGADAEGFGTLVLLPGSRRKYLTGRNLALFPMVGGICLILVLLYAVVMRPAVSTMMVLLMQILQVYLSFCIAGNFMSQWAPFRIGTQPMRSVRNQWPSILVAFASLILVPILFLPTIFCLMLDPTLEALRGYRGIPLAPLVSAAFLVITAFVYQVGTASAARRLAKSEQRILERLSTGQE